MQLEENIRLIALSGDWVKLVDHWLVEASATQSAASATVSTQKRGPGRRSKRQFGVSEVTDDISLDRDFTWWRGGKLSKQIFQRGILPLSAVKSVARQGNFKVYPFNYLLSEENDCISSDVASLDCTQSLYIVMNVMK